MKKLKVGLFDVPQIREVMEDPMFNEALSKAKMSAANSLNSVVTNFLVNYLSAEYKKEIEELLKIFCHLGAQMSIRMHFLRLHWDYFTKNCGEQG